MKIKFIWKVKWMGFHCKKHEVSPDSKYFGLYCNTNSKSHKTVKDKSWSTLHNTCSYSLEYKKCTKDI